MKVRINISVLVDDPNAPCTGSAPLQLDFDLPPLTSLQTTMQDQVNAQAGATRDAIAKALQLPPPLG